MNSGRRTMTAERMRDDERIVLDGILDEPAWGRAEHGGEFIMQDPVLGGTPTERTEVRIVFNQDHLYIGATMYDSEPDKLKGNTSKRDEFLSADDRFMWTMDTFLNQQTGYFFEMNPSGLMADALKGPSGSNAREWDGIWNAQARQSEIGWVLEIDLPFRTLAFDPNAPAWGINFQRTVRRKKEELLWTGHQRNQGLQRMANAGLLVGIKDVSPGPRLRAATVRGRLHLPTRPGAHRRCRATPSGDVGIDMAYNLTPSLRGVGTINTDFAETEVDQRLVNLTRFPLFLPERADVLPRRRDLLRSAVQRVLLTPHRPRSTGSRSAIDRRQQAERPGRPATTSARSTCEPPTRTSGVARRELPGGAHGAGASCSQSYVGGFYTGRDDPRQRRSRHAAHRRRRLPAGHARRSLGNKNLGASGYGSASRQLRRWTTPLSPRRQHRRARATLQRQVRYLNDIWEASRSSSRTSGSALRPRGRVHAATRISASTTPSSPGARGRRRATASSAASASASMPTVYHRPAEPQAVASTSTCSRAASSCTAATTPRPASTRPTSGSTTTFQIVPGVILPGGIGLLVYLRYRVTVNTANQRVVALPSRGRMGRVLLRRPHREIASASMCGRGRAYASTSLTNSTRVSSARGPVRHPAACGWSPTRSSAPSCTWSTTSSTDSVSRVLGWQARFRWIVRPGQRRLLRLHPQLGRGSARPEHAVPHARSARRRQGGLHEAILRRLRRRVAS